MKNKNTLGMLLVFIAAVLWSTNSILVKNIELPSMLIGAMRALIAGIVLAPFIRPKKLKFSPKMLLMAVAFTLNSVGVVTAIKLTSAAIAVGMQFTSPIWLYIYSRIKGYPFIKRRVIPLAVLTAGVVISMFSKAEGVTLIGNLIALTTGLSFAVVTQLGKDLGGDNPVGITAINNLFMAAVILPRLRCAAFHNGYSRLGNAFGAWHSAVRRRLCVLYPWPEVHNRCPRQHDKPHGDGFKPRLGGYIHSRTAGRRGPYRLPCDNSGYCAGGDIHRAIRKSGKH